MDIFSILAIIVMLVAVVTGFIKRFSYTNVLVVANLFVFMLTLLAPAMPGGLTAVQTDLGFRAVAVPPGKHTVRFVYRPLSVWAGMALVLAGVVVAWITVRRARARAVTPA